MPLSQIPKSARPQFTGPPHRVQPPRHQQRTKLADNHLAGIQNQRLHNVVSREAHSNEMRQSPGDTEPQQIRLHPELQRGSPIPTTVQTINQQPEQQSRVQQTLAVNRFQDQERRPRGPYRPKSPPKIRHEGSRMRGIKEGSQIPRATDPPAQYLSEDPQQQGHQTRSPHLNPLDSARPYPQISKRQPRVPDTHQSRRIVPPAVRTPSSNRQRRGRQVGNGWAEETSQQEPEPRSRTREPNSRLGQRELQERRQGQGMREQESRNWGGEYRQEKSQYHRPFNELGREREQQQQEARLGQRLYREERRGFEGVGDGDGGKGTEEADSSRSVNTLT